MTADVPALAMVSAAPAAALAANKIAFYDMDRTITRRGTYSGFLLYVLCRRQSWRFVFLPFVVLAVAAYALHLIDRARLKTIFLILLVGRTFDEATLAPFIESYATKICADNIHQAALDQIAADRADGYRICLVTASFRLYVAALARRWEIADVIATDLLPGQAKFDGPNCYHTAKLILIRAWLEREKLERSTCHIRAYSDHVSDAAMLDFADEPYAATPSAALRRLAKRRGWPVLDWKAKLP